MYMCVNTEVYIMASLATMCSCTVLVNYSVAMYKVCYNMLSKYLSGLFLNQVHIGRRPVHAWFLKFDPVQTVSMHVCTYM